MDPRAAALVAAAVAEVPPASPLRVAAIVDRSTPALLDPYLRAGALARRAEVCAEGPTRLGRTPARPYHDVCKLFPGTSLAAAGMLEGSLDLVLVGPAGIPWLGEVFAALADGGVLIVGEGPAARAVLDELAVLVALEVEASSVALGGARVLVVRRSGERGDPRSTWAPPWSTLDRCACVDRRRVAAAIARGEERRLGRVAGVSSGAERSLGQVADASSWAAIGRRLARSVAERRGDPELGAALLDDMATLAAMSERERDAADAATSVVAIAATARAVSAATPVETGTAATVAATGTAAETATATEPATTTAVETGTAAEATAAATAAATPTVAATATAAESAAETATSATEIATAASTALESAEGGLGARHQSGAADWGVDLLLLVPHPDDETVYFGGLVAAASRAGLRLHVATLTGGEGGLDLRSSCGRGGGAGGGADGPVDPLMAAEEEAARGGPSLMSGISGDPARPVSLAEARALEQAAALEALGAGSCGRSGLGFADTGKYVDDRRSRPMAASEALARWDLSALVDRLVMLLSDVRPRAMVTMDPIRDPNYSLHAHHLACGAAALVAAGIAATSGGEAGALVGVWTVQPGHVGADTGAEATDRVRLGLAQIPVDIDRKLAALAAYPSQGYSTQRQIAALEAAQAGAGEVSEVLLRRARFSPAADPIQLLLGALGRCV